MTKLHFDIEQVQQLEKDIRELIDEGIIEKVCVMLLGILPFLWVVWIPLIYGKLFWKNPQRKLKDFME